MLFRLSSSGSFYSDKDAGRLQRLGFKFEPMGDSSRWYQTSDGRDIEISTIPDLMKFVKKYGQVVVRIQDGENVIEIYDNYRE